MGQLETFELKETTIRRRPSDVAVCFAEDATNWRRHYQSHGWTTWNFK